MPDFSRFFEHNRHDVKAHLVEWYAGPASEIFCPASDPNFFVVIDFPLRQTELRTTPGLHFYDYQDFPFHCHDVQFAGARWRPVVPRNHRHSLLLQVAMGQIFRQPACRKIGIPSLSARTIASPVR
jgi:hypothetical protein